MDLYQILASEYKEIFPSSKEKLNFVESLLEPEQPQKILDIGCASGEFSCQLYGPQRKITAIDLDSEMIKEALSKRPLKWAESIQF